MNAAAPSPTPISTSLIFFRRILPTFWFGMLGLMCVLLAIKGTGESDPLGLALLPVMIVGGFLLFRTLFWCQADLVLDAGDALIVRKGATELRLPFERITRVSLLPLLNPPRITLHLASPGPLGDRIHFSPALPLWFYPRDCSPIVEALAERARRARSQ
jgi:hypothetical protein